MHSRVWIRSVYDSKCAPGPDPCPNVLLNMQTFNRVSFLQRVVESLLPTLLTCISSHVQAADSAKLRLWLTICELYKTLQAVDLLLPQHLAITSQFNKLLVLG